MYAGFLAHSPFFAQAEQLGLLSAAVPVAAGVGGGGCGVGAGVALREGGPRNRRVGSGASEWFEGWLERKWARGDDECMLKRCTT